MLRKNITTLFLVVQVLYNSVYCNQRICMQIEEGNPLSTNRGVQGATGKRGAPGPIGPVGPAGRQGEQGIVDYNRINRVIKSVINNLREEFNEKMNRTIMEIHQKMTTTCEIVHNEKCYWMEIRETSMNFNEARGACVGLGMNIGYLEDQTHYEKIAQLVRSKTTLNLIRYWTGLQYRNPNVVTLSGESAPFVEWYPSKPNTESSSFTHIYVYVKKDVDNKYQGMYNYQPSHSLGGVLCQSQLFN